MGKVKPYIPLILLLVSVVIISIGGISYIPEWCKGDFCEGYSDCITVYLTDRQKPGKICIHTYTCALGTGHTGTCSGNDESLTKLKVKVCDQWGDEICVYNATSRSTIDLNSDHAEYKIYIACRQDLGDEQRNAENRAKCVHWAVETINNTQIK
ncbi:MAG: hypothetical protein IJF88_10120 [Oscillospiraceae bacterium]|nr:hypothetical protein [Oscillospiraceae bacterium]